MPSMIPIRIETVYELNAAPKPIRRKASSPMTKKSAVYARIHRIAKPRAFKKKSQSPSMDTALFQRTLSR